MFLPLLACHRPDLAQDPSPAYALALEHGELVLRRGDDALLRLPVGAIRLGEVDGYDPLASYDPFWTDPYVHWVRATGASGDGPYTLTFDDGSHGTLSVSSSGEGSYQLDLVPDAPNVAYFRLGLTIDPDEGLYGLGSALDAPNRRGTVRGSQLELDGSTESGDNEAHVHVPFVVGTRGWGVLVRDDHPSAFDFGASEADLLEVTVGTGTASPGGLAFDWYAAQHPLDVTARYWQATGVHRLPARWALGPLLWRNENTGQAQVEADLDAMRDLDLATSAIWIDRPYASGVNTFDFDPAKYPDPDAMIAKAHDLGFRMSLWHTPYVDDTEAADLYAEAEAGGYFAPVHPPVFVQWGSPIDFTNPAAYAWWQALIGRYQAQGIEGYKLDYAEEVVIGALGGRLPWQFADGSDELVMHAGYQRLYHQVYAETLPEDGGFLLCRSGTLGDQVHGPVIWPGDLDATMAAWAEPAVDRDGSTYTSVGGLPASLVDALSLGPSGFPFYGSDTGGYRHSPPDNETFVRWFEQTALSSVMQIGTASSDVAWEPTAENGFDADTLAWYRDYTRLHLRLWPYLWSYAAEIGRGEGRPLMRALGLAHPELGVHPGDEYLLGDWLLVAPVVTRGAREREVTFPDGDWIGWFDGEVHHGGVETVPAELDQLPLYLAAGGIVPMLRPTIDTLSPTTAPDRVDSYATDPGPLWVRIFAGPASRFEGFDGFEVAQEDQGDRVRVDWTDGAELAQGAVLELVGEGEPSAVTLDGTSTTGWSWDPGLGGTVTVTVPAGTREVEVVR